MANTTGMKKTLGLTGVTVNAMALIAPGAFLWITFQIQAANTGGASDMWTGIVAALIVAFLTAFSFSEMAKRYPDAGAGGSYYFAEKAFLDREKASHQRFARIAKFLTGWAAHLFYWVYPGVMVAFMAVLVTYLVGAFGVTLSIPMQIVVAVVFSVIVGLIAVRGISGSTNAAIVINVIQLVSLIGFSVLAIMFRVQNPLHATQWAHPAAFSIVWPHSLSAMLFQSTIAILILVGFESSTSLGAEAINPKRDIPRGIILSLVIQGLFAYLLEYFAANFAVSEKLVYQKRGRHDCDGDGCRGGVRCANRGYGRDARGFHVGRERIRADDRHCDHGRDRRARDDPGGDEYGGPDQFRHGAGQ